MSAQKFRKKPVVIEAIRWTGDSSQLDDFLGSQNWTRADAREIAWEHDDPEEVVIWNQAEKGWVPAPVGWWIIRGVQGEFYPCKPDIFEATYEPAS